MPRLNKQDFFCWISLVFIASAWHFPGEWPCAILTWIGCAFFAGSLPYTKKPYSILYSAGIVLYAIGFYWLFYTIRDFGGFGNFISFLIFSLFIIVSAWQFLLLVFVWKNLPEFFHKNSIAAATAWVTAELLSIKIFPWQLGHSQLAVTYLAQAAEIAGAVPISFLIIWFSDSLIQSFRENKRKRSLYVSALVMAAVLTFGYSRTQYFRNASYPAQNVTLVQANISLEEKHDLRLPKFNLNRYVELSRPYTGKDTLVIWPESALTEFISSHLKNVSEEPYGRLPSIANTPLLLGGLTFESREKLYNSAIGISGDGSVAGIYNKQILMPFGEYTPFAGIFPWLKDINATAGEFSAGDKISVIEFKTNSNSHVKISPLICYEDVIPSLARAAALSGAEVLVNITNDAWFGNTIAPYQHNLIASFRAIENRRYLLRATNTGLTAIINPLGENVASLEPYKEGVLNYQINSINFKALSSYYDFQYILWIGALVILIIAVLRRILNETRQS
jgi:apolipoprotein N-acyltransferase